MLEDILLIEKKHRLAAKQIISMINYPLKEKLVIAVGGESGSGKSELAHMIGRLLKNQKKYAKILHTDDFYIIKPRERNNWRKKHGIKSVGINEYNWKKIDSVILNFKKNRKVKLPCVDLITDQVDTLITDYKEVNVLIVEGLYAVNVKADERVFINLTFKETKKAQILRFKEPQNKFRVEILKREHDEILSFKDLATIIVNKQYQAQKIK